MEDERRVPPWIERPEDYEWCGTGLGYRRRKWPSGRRGSGRKNRYSSLGPGYVGPRELGAAFRNLRRAGISLPFEESDEEE